MNDSDVEMIRSQKKQTVEAQKEAQSPQQSFESSLR
jgi:hypothetical protein